MPSVLCLSVYGNGCDQNELKKEENLGELPPKPPGLRRFATHLGRTLLKWTNLNEALLFAGQEPRHFGAADRAFTFGHLATFGRLFYFAVFDLPLLPAFHAISFKLHPKILLVSFGKVMGQGYPAQSLLEPIPLAKV